MSLWKKIASPGSGTQRKTARAASPNHCFQPSKPRSGSSETSGKEVITLAPGGAGFSASQVSASAWMMRFAASGAGWSRVGARLTAHSNGADFGDLGFDGFPLGEPSFDLRAEGEVFALQLLDLCGAGALEEAVYRVAVGDRL